MRKLNFRRFLQGVALTITIATASMIAPRTAMAQTNYDQNAQSGMMDDDNNDGNGWGWIGLLGLAGLLGLRRRDRADHVDTTTRRM